MIEYSERHDLSRYKMYLSNFDNKEIDWYGLSGLSSHSDYIPFYAAWNSVITYKKGDDAIIQYSIPDVELYDNGNFNKPKTLYGRMENWFRYNLMPMTFKTKSLNRPLHVMKGLIFEVVDNEPVIHALLAIKQKYLMDITKETTDYSKFALFLSPEFSSEDTKLVHVYKRLYKDLFKRAITQGLDVIVSDKIDQWCFNNSTPLPKFKTIEGRQAYYNKLKSELIL